MFLFCFFLGGGGGGAGGIEYMGFGLCEERGGRNGSEDGWLTHHRKLLIKRRRNSAVTTLFRKDGNGKK